MPYVLIIFLAVAASLAAAGILTFILQFFADGWQLPTKEKLASLSIEEREKRRRQIPIMFAVWFIAIILLLTFLWHLGATP